ncbi:hypothetical protein L917_10727 [Phytophthora nicotianae]|uniref:Uncharacterized protein n=3 Tax=Phytophthora nicotianae TaxID=4792 RepID=V9EZW1_PHYNI|nr:hypothetical protein F443_11213 [Phytophthora nicotianae P1569]ETL90631.1 hypothetical protein L917_10727 [Phytophthora nicotianae]
MWTQLKLADSMAALLHGANVPFHPPARELIGALPHIDSDEQNKSTLKAAHIRGLLQQTKPRKGLIAEFAAGYCEWYSNHITGC